MKSKSLTSVCQSDFNGKRASLSLASTGDSKLVYARNFSGSNNKCSPQRSDDLTSDRDYHIEARRGTHDSGVSHFLLSSHPVKSFHFSNKKVYFSKVIFEL